MTLTICAGTEAVGAGMRVSSSVCCTRIFLSRRLHPPDRAETHNRQTHSAIARRDPKSSSLVSALFDLHEAAIKSRAAAEVGEPLGNQRIHVATAEGPFV